MNINFQDKATIGTVKQTGEGYVSAVARVARTGIQEYTRSELGLFGDGVVRVYRPESEVFNKESLQTYSHAPVTIDHPPVLVDSANWREYAVGEVSTDVLRDGEFIAVPLILKDANARLIAESGKSEISMGYTAAVTMQDGVSPDGEQYDAIQTDIRINHLAIVDKGRAGSNAKLPFGDKATKWGAAPLTTNDKGPVMDIVKVMVGDKAVQVAASDVDTVTALVADHAAAIADKDTQIGALKAECAEANSKTMDADAIDALVAEKVAVIDKARSVVADYDPAGKSVNDIRRDVVRTMHGDDAAAESVSDAEVKGVFDFATSKPKNDKARDAIRDGVKKTDESHWGFLNKDKN